MDLNIITIYAFCFVVDRVYMIIGMYLCSCSLFNSAVNISYYIGSDI